MTAMTETQVSVSGFGTDYQVGRNTNTATSDKVNAFVNCMLDRAQTVSARVYNLPVKFILAHWAAESGWGTSAASARAQNWAGLMYHGTDNYCKGEDAASGMSMFYGKRTFANAYANRLLNVSNYSNLRAYLQSSAEPSVEICIYYISGSGYSESDADAYGDLIRSCVSSIERYTDIA